MIEAQEALLIGMFAGFLLGYAAGFLVSRMIYRVSK